MQRYYDLVAAELKRRDLKDGLWARALAETGADDSKARARYIKLRAEELSHEEEQRRRKQSEHIQRQSEAQRLTVKGLSLQPVVEAVKERRLEWLRALPSAYRNQRHDDETFVDHLSVLDVGNLPKSEPIHCGPLSEGRSGGDIRQSVSPTGDFKCTTSGI